VLLEASGVPICTGTLRWSPMAIDGAPWERAIDVEPEEARRGRD
jgi:hypothetical protein